jgi:hypothetical protein
MKLSVLWAKITKRNVFCLLIKFCLKISDWNLSSMPYSSDLPELI